MTAPVAKGIPPANVNGGGTFAMDFVIHIVSVNVSHRHGELSLD